MIRRSFVLSAAAMTLALAGCNSNNPDANPSPTPTPSPTASPTPTPVSYATFPLTANAEFGTINAFTSYTGDLAVGPVTLGVAGTEAGSTRFRLAALADPTAASTATPSVVHENPSEESRFVAADLTAGVPPSTGVTEYAFLQNGTTAGQTSRAEFLNNTVTGKVTSNTALQLLRTSYTGWIRADSTAGGHRITYGVWGYPTVLSDMPTTGTATYTVRIAGRAVGVIAAGTGTVSKLGGTVTVTINWATGGVTLTANVTTIGAGGVETPYGTYTASAAIASGATQFSGPFGAGSPIPGTISGTVFGPAGAEIGIAFAGAGTTGGVDTRLVGVMVGKKN